MNDDDEPTEAVGNKIPLLAGTDGQVYIPADVVIQLLRAIANSCRNLHDDPDCDLLGAAAAIDLEADAIECRAIMQTR
ncbi:hypothetical protein [Streptomyces sp. NBC_01353]|uniref:hypothetical protein n=1 Tax=Streptomyces sp. NBC_01353 TaxID=2903835 RepID=UPI002E32DC52|nr:hypothetical protein [Streptomyces sp. NBC_01353]